MCDQRKVPGSPDREAESIPGFFYIHSKLRKTLDRSIYYNYICAMGQTPIYPIRLKPELRRRIKKLARARDGKEAHIVVAAINEYLEKHDKP